MSSLAEKFRNVEGAQLRVAATLDSLDYEMEFVREDLEGTYSSGDLDYAYNTIVANRLSANEFSQIGEFGALDCQLLIFERIIVFLFPSSRYGGLFVSFDREEPFPFLDIVETASDIRHIE